MTRLGGRRAIQQRTILAVALCALFAACGDPTKHVQPIRPSGLSLDAVPTTGVVISQTCFHGTSAYSDWRFVAVLYSGSGAVLESKTTDITGGLQICNSAPGYQILTTNQPHDNSYEYISLHWYRKTAGADPSQYKDCSTTLVDATQRLVYVTFSSAGVAGICYDINGGSQIKLDWTPVSYAVASVGVPLPISLIGGASSSETFRNFARAANGQNLIRLQYTASIADPIIATVTCGTDVCTFTGAAAGSTTYTVTTGGMTTSPATITVDPAVVLRGPSDVFTDKIIADTVDLTYGYPGKTYYYTWYYQCSGAAPRCGGGYQLAAADYGLTMHSTHIYSTDNWVNIRVDISETPSGPVLVSKVKYTSGPMLNNGGGCNPRCD